MNLIVITGGAAVPLQPDLFTPPVIYTLYKGRESKGEWQSPLPLSAEDVEWMRTTPPEQLQ